MTSNIYNSLDKEGMISLTTAKNIPQFDHLYNFENAELKDTSSESQISFGHKYNNYCFETLISDFLGTSDVIIIKFDALETIEDTFEYKLLRLFYSFGFPIVGVPLDFSGEKKTKPMLFFIGCKKRDDKLVSVVNYCLNKF